MAKYGFFLGCIMPLRYPGIESSTRAVMDALGVASDLFLNDFFTGKTPRDIRNSLGQDGGFSAAPKKLKKIKLADVFPLFEISEFEVGDHPKAGAYQHGGPRVSGRLQYGIYDILAIIEPEYVHRTAPSLLH